MSPSFKFQQTTLADSKKITRTAKLQILSCNIKSIIGFIEDLQTFRSIFFIISLDKNAVRLMLSTPYTAPKLMKLGQPETLGVLNHHHRSIGHIYTNFYYGGGNENLCFALHKLLHLYLLFGRFHLAMNLTQFEFRECLFQRFVTFFQVLQVGSSHFL